MSNLVRETIIAEDQFPVVVSHFESGSGYRQTNFCHSEIEFQFVCSGEGKYFIKDQVYEFGRNSVLLIHRDEIHSRLPGSCELVKRINLLIGPKYLHMHPFVGDIEDSLKVFHHISLQEKQAIVVRMLLDEISSECKEKNEYWEDVVSANIHKIIVILYRSRSLSTVHPAKLSLMTMQLLQYLDQCFTSHITLDDLAEKFNMSKFWLSRRFREETGTSIRDYIILKRIVLAKTLLQTTDMKIIAISSMVGFEDLSTFNRDFKLRTGLAPSIYRKISP